MTTTQSNETMANKHAELEGLLPGYVKGTLTPIENAMLKRHLIECEICRREIPHCEFLAGHLPSATETWKPWPAHFAKILAEVDKLEAATGKPEKRRLAAPPGLFRRINTCLTETPRPVRWTLALETFAFAVLALFVVLPHGLNSTAGLAYETLSNTETPAITQGLSVRLMFAEDMTIRELSGLMKQAKAQIRQGPSAVGYYTVEVAIEDAAKSLVILRAHPKVRLALSVEPLSSNP
jgi:Putative zinc-finger